MKKFLQFAVLPVLAVCMMFALAACNSNKEVVGVYEMTSITGTVSGVPVTKDMYEYYRLTLNEDGTGKVESKSYGIEFEGEGTYEYSGGKIKFKSKDQTTGLTVTEEFEYKDGEITYVCDNSLYDIHFTLVLTRVED